MKIRSYVGLSSLLAVGALLMQACAAPSSEEKTEATDDQSSAFSLFDTRVVGSIDYGQTSPETPYTRVPRYRAYKFSGNSGDEIDVWVRSSNGDPITWIVDNDWNAVARNDDAASGNTDSHIKVKLPANASKTHYVVVRDYYLDSMSFRVSLAGSSGDFVSGCEVDADCVKVQKNCCPHLGNIAIRSGKEAAYKASLHCEVPTVCPAIAIMPDDSMAQCNAGTHKCELVKPREIACGGFTRNPHSCPDGYRCKLPANVADVPGKCVQFCGGIAAFPCRDPNEECADDPSDTCDPRTGGADCGGICLPKPTDCRASGCSDGRHCSRCWGGYACIPNGAVC